MLSARTLDTPYISDTIPLAEGVLGTVEELLAEVGQTVEENEVRAHAGCAVLIEQLFSAKQICHANEMKICACAVRSLPAQVIAVVETDKVALDVKASQPGVIAEILVQVGDEVKEEQALYTLED